MDILKNWADFLWEVRAYFRRQDFIEVFTPIAVLCPGTEPSIEPFATDLKIGRGRRQLFLRTSPELKIKRLLSDARPRIFEIGPVFRNEESTDLHEPEFMMLEWYRENTPLAKIKDDVENLIRELSKKFTPPNKELKALEFKHLTVKELIKQAFRIEIEPTWQKTDYKAALMVAGIDRQLPPEPHQEAWMIDDYFFMLMQAAEQKMDQNKIYFISEYPPFQAAYSKLLPNGWAGRFEVYWRGMELANAFWEITDSKIQRERFQSDLKKKQEQNKTSVPIDEDFLAYLDFRTEQRDSQNNGPSGIALGLERLFMALTEIEDIKRLKPFPYSDLL